MWLNVVLLVFSHLILPAVFLSGLALHRHSSQVGWLLTGLVAGWYSVYLFLAGRWDWFGYPLRYALLAVSGIVALVSYGQVKGSPLVPGAGGVDWMNYGIQGAVLTTFALLAVKAVRGRRCPAGGVEAAFPLRNGTYYICHGGSDAIVNYHYARKAQRFALDVVKLNRAGLRAWGFYPKRLDRYGIFGEPVYSPVAGTVLRAADGQPDLTPPERDADRVAGNHVVVRPSGTEFYVILAHLQSGSILVREGDAVEAGQPVGRIGNSGNTSEPHLHIHCATLDGEDYTGGGEGVPLVFGGRFLTRNSLVRS